MEDKNSIRRRMRDARRSLSADEKRASDRLINGRLMKRIEELKPLSVAVYLPSPDEIDIIPCVRGLLARKITAVSPKWNGETYILSRLSGLGNGFLAAGPMGIREPVDANAFPPAEVDVWIVPGLAFSSDGGRIGYGGGWYDRLMSEASASAHKIAVARSFQIFSTLPTSEKDVPIDEIIDDSRDVIPDTCAPRPYDTKLCLTCRDKR